jgi:hypothetical protein
MKGLAYGTFVVGMRQLTRTTVAIILFTAMSMPAALEDFYHVANAQSLSKSSSIYPVIVVNRIWPTFTYTGPFIYVHAICGPHGICYIKISAAGYSIYCVGLSESGYRCYNNFNSGFR